MGSTGKPFLTKSLGFMLIQHMSDDNAGLRLKNCLQDGFGSLW